MIYIILTQLMLLTAIYDCDWSIVLKVDMVIFSTHFNNKLNIV